MTGTIVRRLLAASACLMLGAIALQVRAANPPATAEGSGDLWEVTSQMSMEGMPMAMPPQTSKVCSPKEWKEPPSGADDRHKCVNSDFKVEGPKASWKVACAGPPPMTGEAEIVRDGAAAYAGTIKFASEQAKMTVKLNGKRVGACEPPKK